MKNTMIDPIVAEVRAVRDKHASKFGYDLSRIFLDVKARQETSGREFVKFSSRGDYTKKREALLGNPTLEKLVAAIQASEHNKKI